ncbi:MAG TPA: hypothetical protein VFX09_06720, partial [Burkholderiales bacterium]|nr:hypothetical protein [Burkholderiales bacterium]
MAAGEALLSAHERKLAALAARLKEEVAVGGAPLALAKETSNLFRDRAGAPRRRLDVRNFSEVLGVGDGWVEAEGMVTYESLVDA